MSRNAFVLFGAAAVMQLTCVESASMDSVMKKDFILENWPQPGKDYYGQSHVGRWTYAPENIFPRRNLAEETGFSNLPAVDPLGDLRPPQPTNVNATPPFRMDTVFGNCTIPKSASLEGVGGSAWGAHIWLANLLYSEFIPWPIDIWMEGKNAQTHPDDPNSWLFNFRIPLWDHVNDKDHPLYWHQWAAGPGGVLHQTLVGMPETEDTEWLKEAGSAWYSSTPAIHSWASFGAGEWTIFCNSWVVEPTEGKLRVSTYKALDDMEVDLAAARAGPDGRYKPSLDSIDGPTQSRWDDGHNGLWLDGKNGAGLVDGAPNAITGKWGKHITFDKAYNYKQECCWRSYTGPGAVMRDLWTRTVANLTVDDCCWFGLPPHTHDPLYPPEAQPVVDSSKFAMVYNATADVLDVGYWGYRRTLSPRAEWMHTYTSDPIKKGMVYPEIWTYYGETGGLMRADALTTSSNLFILPKVFVETGRLLDATPLAGGIILHQAYGWYNEVNIAVSVTTTRTFKSSMNIRDYRWYTDEWVLEFQYPDSGEGVKNMSDARTLKDLGPDWDPIFGVRTTSNSEGGINNIHAMQTFRAFTHGWNTFRTLHPLEADNLGWTFNINDPPPNIADRCCNMSVSGVTPGIKQTYMARLTPQVASWAWVPWNATSQGMPASNTFNNMLMRNRPNPPFTVDAYANGGIGNGSTVWNALSFTMPKRNQPGPRWTGKPQWNKIEYITNKVPTWGWSRSNPAKDAYVGVPYTLRMSDLHPLGLWEDSPLPQNLLVTGLPNYRTPYDNLTFTFTVVDASNPGMPWSDATPLGSYPSSVFNSQKVEGDWNTAQWTLTPTTPGHMYIVNVTVWDTGFGPSQLAFLNLGNNSRVYVEGPQGTTFSYFLSSLSCPDCAPGHYPVQGCGGRGKPTVCAACNTTCAAGQYISAPCNNALTGGSDLRCTSCLSTCPLGQYLSNTCNGATTQANTCKQCSACPVGQYASGGCTGSIGGTADTVCSPCPNITSSPTGTLFVPPGCPTTITGTSLVDAINRDPNSPALAKTGSAIYYRSCTACTDGVDYASIRCNTSMDTVCSPCKAPCGGGSYEAIACTKDHDRTCRACTTTCPTGQYRSAPCTSSTDAICSACSTMCPAWSFKTAECTGTADITCNSCNCSRTGAAGCDAIAGSCICKAGFTGERCDQCVAGMWGSTCSETCACSGAGSTSTSCSTRDGKCTCKAGWTGFYCDRCEDGKYGATCSNTCTCGPKGYCVDGVSGDGACVCQAGWTGPRCLVFTDSPFQVFPGEPLPPIEGREGVLYSQPVPLHSFVLVSSGTQYGLSSDIVNCTLRGGASWLSVIPSTGSASGFILTGTPTRADVASGVTAVLIASGPGTGEATMPLSVSVVHVNLPPTLPSLPLRPTTVRVGAQYRLALTWGVDVADEDVASFGDTVTVSLTGLPSWVTVLPSTRDGQGRQVWSARGAPPDTAAGTSTTITITVTDGQGATAVTTTTVTVRPSGDASSLSFVGLPAIHVLQGTTLNLVLPTTVFEVMATEPGSTIMEYTATAAQPMVTANSRRMLLSAAGTVIESHPSSVSRRLSQTSPTVTTLTHGARVLAGAYQAVQAEMQAKADEEMHGRRLQREARRLAELSAVSTPNPDAPTLTVGVDISMEEANTLLETQERREDTMRKAQDELWDTYQLMPKPADILAVAERRVLSALGACSWLGLARSTDSPPRPLLWGTPDASDVGTVCEIEVTATNEAGFSVSGRVSVVVDDRNDPPSTLTTLPPVTRPALQVFTLTWDMSQLFADADAPGTPGSNGKDIISFSLAELGSTGGMSSAPPFLTFSCVGGRQGAIMDTCTLRGNAPVASMGTYGLEIVAKDSSNATATLPLLLKISAPTIFTLRSTSWSPCTEECGGGTRHRTHTCIDYRGLAVEAENCATNMAEAGISGPVETESCNVSPCSGSRWEAGEWGQCSATCASPVPRTKAVFARTFVLPTATRNITCVAANGVDVLGDDACSTLPRPPTTRECNTQACPGSGNGTYSGGLCNGVIDAAGECCDAPGPSGYCCLGASGNDGVDECGVCDGLNACPLTTRLTLASTALATRLCGASFIVVNNSVLQDIQDDITRAIAEVLGVPASSVSIGALACVSTVSARRMGGIPSWRKLQASASSPTSVSMQVTVSEQARASAVTSDLLLRERLPTVFALATGMTTTVLDTQVTRESACGNNVCETSESCGDTTCDTTKACPADCGTLGLSCPVDGTGRPCGGVGGCQLASGLCACGAGYYGEVCESCAEGYSRKVHAGKATCIRVTDLIGDEPFTAKPGFGVLVAFACLVGLGMLYVARRRTAYLQGAGDISKPKRRSSLLHDGWESVKRRASIRASFTGASGLSSVSKSGGSMAGGSSSMGIGDDAHLHSSTLNPMAGMVNRGTTTTTTTTTSGFASRVALGGTMGGAFSSAPIQSRRSDGGALEGSGVAPRILTAMPPSSTTALGAGAAGTLPMPASARLASVSRAERGVVSRGEGVVSPTAGTSKASRGPTSPMAQLSPKSPSRRHTLATTPGNRTSGSSGNVLDRWPHKG